jgi:branched-chain amino acid transport system ATP-binding protein
MSSPLALELRDVHAGYGSTEVLRGVSLSVPAGSVVTLLGPNGAGKSTLLKVAAGLLPVGGGQVFLNGEDVTTTPSFAMARKGLCLLPEGRGIFPTLSVRENLELMGATGREAQDEVFSLFPVLGERTAQTAGTLSGGQQQMLAVARAVVAHAEIVLADEISFGLAPIVVDEIFAVLDQLRARGLTVLLVEQYIHRALAFAEYAYLMYKGGIVFAGETFQLKDRDVIERYFGKAGDNELVEQSR